MPKFHLQILPLINANNDYHIEIDNIPYNEYESYSQCNTIFFSNKYGSIRLKGYFNLLNKNIPTLIVINKLYIEISKQLLNACIYNFAKYKLEIEFNFSYDDIKYIKNIEQNLIKEYNCRIDYNNRKIYILLNEIKNIDIINQINGYLENEENLDDNYIKILKSRQKIKNIDDDKIIQFHFDNIHSNIKNDENKQNENVEEIDESFNNVEMEDISKFENPFITSTTEKIEEKKIDTLTEFNLNKDITNIKKNYIKFSDLKNLNNLKYNNEEEIYINKILNPNIKNEVNKLISNGGLFMKKNIKTNIVNSININGFYLLLNNDEKNGNKITLNKLILNNDIGNNTDNLIDYQKIIFDNYINIFDNTIINKKNKNLDINDYTYIILTFINTIQNRINDIEKRQNKNDDKCIEKYKVIISTLKLFSILFLNCYMFKQEKEYINDHNLFTNSFSDKVMSYRKRLLIEWCIEEQKNKMEKNIGKINIDENDIKSNYEQLYSFGQIKQNRDRDNNKKMSLFMRAKMANNNEKISKNNMYYFTGYNPLYGENNRQFKDIFVDKYNNDWLSFLVQSLLYEEKRDEYIVYSVELLSKYIDNMNNAAKPIININNTVIYDINFILLKLYENYIKCDIDEQIKYLKMISYSCNLTNNTSSDHFIQYIICSTLLKIIPIIFPKYEDIDREITDKIFIKKITYNLLNKSVEDILINTPTINNNQIPDSYIQALKLISLSFLNNKNKNKLINYIISKINIPLELLNSIEENNPLLLTEKQKYSLLGYIYNSQCLWKNAYNCFISAKEYKYALDACINYAIAEIKQYNEKTDFKEIFLRLNEIEKKMPSLFVDIYQSFYLFIKYMNENKNNLMINNISNLLKEFSSKDKYFCNDLIDDSIRGIIIDLLYRLLIKINNEKVAVGNSELISENYVKINTELNMMFNALTDTIKYKNKIFYQK